MSEGSAKYVLTIFFKAALPFLQGNLYTAQLIQRFQICSDKYVFAVRFCEQNIRYIFNYSDIT